MSGALIVVAELAGPDFAFLDAQRRAHFPPERNLLPAHLTLFHALPPSTQTELRSVLAMLAAQQPPPRARLGGLMSLGRGVAYRVDSEELQQLRADIADHFHGALTAQDAQGWRPHVTIQNKVDPAVARALLTDLTASFSPRPLGITGLALHRYAGGPWEFLCRYPFRGVR